MQASEKRFFRSLKRSVPPEGAGSMSNAISGDFRQTINFDMKNDQIKIKNVEWHAKQEAISRNTPRNNYIWQRKMH
ncbi:MAG: hypothetical protein LBC41_02185 [Clostridiales bacterium]|jgi:hypothetical protein|nr:hypothetical protein [Clostridiales bacterium]